MAASAIFRRGLLLAAKLAQAIQQYADSLSESLVNQWQTNDKTRAFRELTAEDLREDADGLYRHLTEWLVAENDDAVEQRQSRLGAYRSGQRIPIEELLWAMVLARRNIHDFVKTTLAAENPSEKRLEMEFMESLDVYFDRATYYAITGYVHHRAKEFAQTSRPHIHA